MIDSDPGRRPAPVHQPHQHPDIHGFVVRRLEDHLAELQRLHAELVGPRPTAPGARRSAAAASATAAARYARDVMDALLSHDAGEPPAVLDEQEIRDLSAASGRPMPATG